MNAELLVNTRKPSNEYMFANQTFEFEFQCNSREQRIILAAIKNNIEKGIKLTQLKIAELSGCSIRAVATVFKKIKIFIGCSWKRLSYRNLYKAIKILTRDDCKISEQRTHQHKDEFFGMRKCYIPFNESNPSIMRGSNMNDAYSYYTDNNNINSCKNFKQIVDNSDSVQSFPPQTWTPISSDFIPNEECMKTLELKENIDITGTINHFVKYNQKKGSKSEDWNLSFKGWIKKTISLRYKKDEITKKEKVKSFNKNTAQSSEITRKYEDFTGVCRENVERSSSDIVSKYISLIKEKLKGGINHQNE